MKKIIVILGLVVLALAGILEFGVKVGVSTEVLLASLFGTAILLAVIVGLSAVLSLDIEIRANRDENS